MPAGAQVQGLSLQTQLEYRWVEARTADGRVLSYGRFSPLYTAILRRPLIGGANIMVDLGMTGYSGGDPGSSVDQRNLRVAVMAQGPRFSLMANASRDTNRVSVSPAAGGGYSSVTVTRNYAVSGILAYPAYPTLSVQYQRSAADSGLGPGSDAATWMLGANYDWGPFRFIADQVTQEVVFSDFASRTRRYGVSFNRSLLPALRLSLEHFATSATASAGGLGSSTAGRVTTARLSASPTPQLVLDGEVGLVSSRQGSALHAARWRGRTHALHLRSEVLPGVRLDLSRLGQLQSSSFGDAQSDQTSGNLAVDLGPGSHVILAASKGTATDASGRQTSRQEGQQISVSRQLSPQRDISLVYSRTLQSYQATRYRGHALVVSLRDQVSPSLGVGASYRIDRRNTVRLGDNFESTTRGLQLDATWLPTDGWSLFAGLGLMRAEGVTRTYSASPYVDARWEVSPTTSLTLRYSLQRTTDEALFPGGATIGGRTSGGFTGRLTRLLANGATVELNYDFQRTPGSLFTWQRAVQLRYSRTF